MLTTSACPFMAGMSGRTLSPPSGRFARHLAQAKRLVDRHSPIPFLLWNLIICTEPFHRLGCTLLGLIYDRFGICRDVADGQKESGKLDHVDYH